MLHWPIGNLLSRPVAVALGIPTHLDDPISFASQAANVILQVSNHV
jgi:hypothetical protein